MHTISAQTLATIASLAAMAFAFGGAPNAPAHAPSDPPTIRIHRHSAWSDTAPKGIEAHGVRRNLARGDELVFEELTVTVRRLEPADGDTEDARPDRVELRLACRGEGETRTVGEGTAFSWRDYHVAVVAIYAKKGELGFGSTVLEVATVGSLPEAVAESTSAGGAENRLRVKHTIDRLTLHHSATKHTAEDDLAQKLRNMQSWGERDRNWFDIPYHFIVDVDGTILQGRDYRYAGDTNTRYDTTGHFLVNCYGNYNEQEPNADQLAAIAGLMAWAALEFDIDPLEIHGHSDLAQTSCPGAKLQAYVENGELERMVRKVMKKGKPRIEWVDEMPKEKR